MGIAHFAYGYCCYCRGMFDEAESNLLKAEALCRKATHPFWESLAWLVLGHVHSDIGKYEIAMSYYNKTILSLELSKGWLSYIYVTKVAKARAEMFNNTQKIDIGELSDLYNNNNIKFLVGWMARYICEILLNLNDQHISDAEDWIKKAIEADRENGTMWSLGRAYALYAELSKRKGEQSKAKENLNKAIEILKECGADGWVERYEKELVALS